MLSLNSLQRNKVMESVLKNSTKLIAAVAGLSLLAFTPAVASSGGGGGGGGFSGGNNNAPRATYNPVVDYQAGIKALQAADYKTADKMFKRVLGGTTKNAQANYYMGVTKVGLGKDKSAVRYFKKAAKYQKGFYEAEGGLGAAYAASGNPEKAQSTLVSLQVSHLFPLLTKVNMPKHLMTFILPLRPLARTLTLQHIWVTHSVSLAITTQPKHITRWLLKLPPIIKALTSISASFMLRLAKWIRLTRSLLS